MKLCQIQEISNIYGWPGVKPRVTGPSRKQDFFLLKIAYDQEGGKEDKLFCEIISFVFNCVCHWNKSQDSLCSMNVGMIGALDKKLTIKGGLYLKAN